jgi:hypothetical protein
MAESRYHTIELEDWQEINVCGDCGSMVINEEQHDKWHEDMHDVAYSAQRADMFTRPIG